MENSKKTVAEVLADKNLFLPGSDFTKTVLFFLFPLILLFSVSNNPIFETNLTVIQPFRNYSTLLLILSLTFAVLSMLSVHKSLNSRFEEITNYFSLFYGKILIECSVLVFFLVVCLWVIVLGGIMRSPFACLLSMSPILLMIQLLRDKSDDYDALLGAFEPFWNTKTVTSISENDIIARKIIFWMQVAPIMLIVSTLLIGQYLISQYNIHEAILGNGFREVIESKWYYRLYYFCYYLSVVIAAIGVIPSEETKKLTQKFF